jgi:hypothetical protein
MAATQVFASNLTQEYIDLTWQSNLHVKVWVKLLNDNIRSILTRTILFSNCIKWCMFQWKIGFRELELIQWTPEYGWAGCVVTEMLIIGLPCNLTSVLIIEHRLGPFGEMLIIGLPCNLTSVLITEHRLGPFGEILIIGLPCNLTSVLSTYLVLLD